MTTHEKASLPPPGPLATLGLRSGLAIPLVFWATLILCARILGGYDPRSRMVSELGELGTPSQALFTAGLVTCAVLSLIFTHALVHRCRQVGRSELPIWIILTYTFSIAGAGIFPYPTRLHLTLGTPSVFLLLSPMLALFLWRPSARLPWHPAVGSLALAIMLLGFLTFFPGVLPGSLGLKQRFFHVGWSVWFAYLSFAFAPTPQPKGSYQQTHSGD